MRIPRYSQFLDVRAPEWRSRACGIVATKMLIDALTPARGKKIATDALIARGIAKGAYINGIGWSHKGLASLARSCGFFSKNHDWFSLSPADALKKLESIGTPLLASVHKFFNPKNGGHIIVVTKIQGNTVFYLEPASRTRNTIARTTSLARFLKGWKRRVITIKKSSRN